MENRGDDDLFSSVRLELNVVAVGCVVGKMFFALVAMFSLKEEDRDGSGGRGDTGEDNSAAHGRGKVVTDDAVA